MPALALTDNGNLYGAIEFYKECKKQNVKPIIGIDAYVSVRTRFDKQAGVDNRRSRLVLLAKNETGYKNLIKLVTAGYMEGFYYKPRIDRETLAAHHEGLIAIMPSISGETALAIETGDLEKARESIGFHEQVFGAENFFLEITHFPDIEGHTQVLKSLVTLGRETETPIMAAHDVYYIHKDEYRARETLVSIQSGADISERTSLGDRPEDFSFISPETAEKYFEAFPEALLNTEKIATLCSLNLELGKWLFPDYLVASGMSHDDELRRLVYEGIGKRGMTETPEVKERIEHELAVIKSKGFSPYFLVVGDLLNYAKKAGIVTTTRGSAGGSLVSYLVGITTIDPIAYKLPFNRFLNPERPLPPDIDMDIADNRRDELIAYAREKYGADKVAQIGTFGTMMARGAVRDVARALGHPYGLGDRIAKIIPMGSQGFPMTIDKSFEIVPELKEMYKKEPEVKEIIDMAKKIEGSARHISVHAAGVVIAPTPLSDYTPIQYDPKGEGKVITQYDMYSMEEVGLLKFDFLGIRNLAILADAVSLVKKLEGTSVDIETIPLDDKKTFELLAKGETGGLFQLNGSGMTRYLKDLKPTTIHDINAMVALYRPGPMESIPEYIERKHNAHLIKYLDPRMKEILTQSYGVITYQDDVMLIAINLAGYSWLEADKLRKAMGKKIPAEMEAQKTKLLEGFVKKGMNEDGAMRLWKLIEPFAAYGFNKAHAASYGRVAYQTAYMKANFPAIYMSAVLTADSGDMEKISEIIAECKRMGLDVLPPNINESFGGFTVVRNHKNLGRDAIRFGLYTIKNLGEGIANTFIAERKRGGVFTSLADFLNRIRDKNLNKKSLEALIKSGSLDEFGERGQMYAAIEKLLEFNKECAKAASNQDSLFGVGNGPELSLPPHPPASAEERLAWEKELLGLYVSGHPLEKHKDKLAKVERTIKNVREELREGMMAVVYGIIEEVKPITTKNNEMMAFLKVADFSGSIEVVVFPKIFKEYKEFIVPDMCIAVKGRVSNRNGTPSVIADKMKRL